jgi:hypothetical protein
MNLFERGIKGVNLKNKTYEIQPQKIRLGEVMYLPGQNDIVSSRFLAHYKYVSDIGRKG